MDGEANLSYVGRIIVDPSKTALNRNFDHCFRKIAHAECQNPSPLPRFIRFGFTSYK